jgi:hypothetical protein
MSDSKKRNDRKLISPSHELVKQAYNETLSMCARLHSFASGVPADGAVDERQELLAAADLIAFSIHARRLIEHTVGQPCFRAITIKRVPAPPETISLVRTINVIVHHDYFDVIRRKSRFYRTTSDRDIASILADYDKIVSPIVVVKSDREKFFAFKLIDLVTTFQNEILENIVEACDDAGLYLQEF